MSGRDRGASL